MKTCRIVIPFTPKPKASIRLGRHSHYNPSARGMQKTREHVKEQLKRMKFSLMTGPLLVIVHFRLPAPLSLPGRKRRLLHLLPHIKKPDGDNLEKFLNDSLNGVVWDDDSRITWLLRSKTSTDSREGETVIFVRQLDNTEPDYQSIIDDIRENICVESGLED